MANESKTTKPTTPATPPHRKKNWKLLGWAIVALIAVMILSGIIQARIFGPGEAAIIDSSSGFSVMERTVMKKAWLEIHVDPNRESLDFNPEDRSVGYYVVLNKDYKNPIHRKAGSRPIDFGEKVWCVSLKLDEDAPKEYNFIIKRIPN